MILHYDSSREGLECIVIELVRAIARKLLHTEISVEIIKQKEQPGDDVQFAIKEIRSPEISTHCVKQTALTRPGRELILLSSEPKISPATFCLLFLFHLMFGRGMKILQEEGIGIFDFTILANFWIGFSVFVPKDLRFLVSVFIAVCEFFVF